MVRVVLDSNVIISAVLFGGKPEKVLNLARYGEIELISSYNLINEVLTVMKKKFNWIDWQVSQVEAAIREMSTIIIPVNIIKVITEDDADNRVLECAYEGRVNYIVSGDRHLLSLKQFEGIKIITPSQFMELMRN